jgi:hypothetical protein
VVGGKPRRAGRLGAWNDRLRIAAEPGEHLFLIGLGATNHPTKVGVWEGMVTPVRASITEASRTVSVTGSRDLNFVRFHASLSVDRSVPATMSSLELLKEGQRGPHSAADSALCDTIRKRWYELLRERDFIKTEGKVVLQFRFHPDGRVTDMIVVENTAGEVDALICEKAVLDPQPYPAWSPSEQAGHDRFRPIQFTFYYHRRNAE